MSTVIRVENLSKKYIIQHQGQASGNGLRHVIQDAVAAPFRKLAAIGKKQAPAAGGQELSHTHAAGVGGPEEFWALKDISFEVKQGDVVGIIGRNGAGKSTLLKVLSRITEPTSGKIHIKGRVASLLEVGTGFHPELTGRENIFLNGAILGMSQAEIREKFDEIVTFAEVEKFLDTPVKRYSSGMYVRLAFAVAAHLEPEILVVDEVLAVGDAQFQKKCLGKMKDVSKDGRTVLFVSHNMSAILQLTSAGIVLDKGNVVYCGRTEDAVAAYAGASVINSRVFFDVEHSSRKHQGTQTVKFVSLRFDREVPMFSFGEDFSFFAKVRALESVPQMRFSMTIFTAEGTAVGSCFSKEGSGISAGKEIEVQVALPNMRLAPGHYYCGVAIGKGNNRNGHVEYDVISDTLGFEVGPEEGEDGTLATWMRGWGPLVFQELRLNIR